VNQIDIFEPGSFVTEFDIVVRTEIEVTALAIDYF
jgi:hypothetical protein